MVLVRTTYFALPHRNVAHCMDLLMTADGNLIGQWIPRMEPGDGPKYLRLVKALARDLHAGEIALGDRLPTQRAVAKALGVDLTTVTRAFNEARARGLIEATIGRGSYISASATAALLPGGLPSMDLSMNIPPQPEGAALARRLSDTIITILAKTGGLAHLNYQDSGGSDPHREAGARFLSGRLPDIRRDRVVVSGGSQNALFALCHMLARSGDTIAAGCVTYPGMQAVAAQLGLRLAGITMDKDGILPSAFAETCERHRPAALYVIPAIDNPTTATIPQERRMQLVDIARHYAVPIIEDDPYSELLDTHLPPFALLAPELTWHISTLSKCATPALRIAYVATPDATGAAALSAILRATSLMPPPLMAAIASHWVASGELDQIASAIRGESRARQEIARAELDGQPFAAHPNGHHIWLSLPRQWRSLEFAHHAERSGLLVVAASAFAVSGPVPEAVRVSLGAAPSRVALAAALGRLRELLTHPPLQARTVV